MSLPPSKASNEPPAWRLKPLTSKPTVRSNRATALPIAPMPSTPTRLRTAPIGWRVHCFAALQAPRSRPGRARGASAISTTNCAMPSACSASTMRDTCTCAGRSGTQQFFHAGADRNTPNADSATARPRHRESASRAPPAHRPDRHPPGRAGRRAAAAARRRRGSPGQRIRRQRVGEQQGLHVGFLDWKAMASMRCHAQASSPRPRWGSAASVSARASAGRCPAGATRS